MTNPRSQLVGCGYAVMAAAAGILAFWQMTFGDFWLGAWMLTAACLAGRCSTALQTIARQRVRLADPRRTDRSGW
ncbi:hypothetical protein ACBJ59_61210 [Nonomuraea sp. MTCD27]|uniref:hypothetical protein n=1 Tax=Nonomuraea sp. MTCD27 TaxID=1676747 RepID=UPI0035C001C1